MDIIPGGIVAPQGFKTAGVYCGIKRKRNDLALIVSDVDAAAAGVFTTNIVKAPCVVSNQAYLEEGIARAIVVNSGNANACNGEQGFTDAVAMVQQAADALGIPQRRVLSASTGVIGHKLPMEKIIAGIVNAAGKLHGEECDDTAQAIMTTDTFPKQVAVEFTLDGKTVRLGAIGKGSGMIAPNMATMLGFITTDAAIEQPVLQEMLRRVAWYTFNSITVDGDTSTNDMTLVLANGLAGNKIIDSLESADGREFEKALFSVCLHLAKEIARDGEGATKLVEVTVQNVAVPEHIASAFASNGREISPEHRAGFPRSVAKTIANSPLVKTALFGNDPNWGRILAAAGRAGVVFDPDKVEIALAGTTVYRDGMPTDFNGYVVSEAMKAKEVQILVDFHQPGGETATVWTCDFSYDYVKINAEYHT
ncbi:MAG: bifunctional glutamate N-acetyltransferase/amino-acid acetyltransferase ArgJ [Capsulimonas sp.]|uniref:bifunctional glutamate N-acetyltransferase/amino-acid acetyltransferase ArgJ n=1 Tax=Capsulimonas sp. TaxID=2494211 RepID=UPI003263D5A7